AEGSPRQYPSPLAGIAALHERKEALPWNAGIRGGAPHRVRSKAAALRFPEMRQAQLCRNCRAEGTERESHACELDLAARKRGQLRTTVVAFPRRISTIGRRQAPLSQHQRRLIDGRLTL